MVRSLAPSQRGKRPLLSEICNELPHVKPTEIIVHKEKRFSKTKEVIIRELKPLCLNDEDTHATKEVISEHELKARNLLKKPFKIPIPGYELSGRSLGLRLAGPRRALYDPYEANALVVYNPPEICKHDKMKLDPNWRAFES